MKGGVNENGLKGSVTRARMMASAHARNTRRAASSLSYARRARSIAPAARAAHRASRRASHRAAAAHRGCAATLCARAARCASARLRWRCISRRVCRCAARRAWLAWQIENRGISGGWRRRMHNETIVSWQRNVAASARRRQYQTHRNQWRLQPKKAAWRNESQ